MSEDAMQDMPKIEAVAVTGPTTITVDWKGERRRSTVDLAGWIGRGNTHIAPLGNPEVFARAAVGAYGGNVTWDEDEGELAIDAAHLEMIADEQEPFGAEDAARWQETLQLSNTEAAELLGLALSTWYAYKAGADIPPTVARLCRAAQRDSLILDAHLRPRKRGRPKGAAPV